MPRKTIGFAVLTLFCLVGSLTGCAPMVATRGNFVEDDRLKTIQMHVSSKDEVQAKIGTPTTIDPFDPNRWFYIGEKTETIAFFDPEIKARKVLAMRFNEEGLLSEVETIDEKSAKDIEIVKQKTKAPGREMTAFEQFFSNLGKFNNVGGMTQQQGPGRQ